ncbi:MAG: hypothetical protein RL630_2130 [Verrucomicrobiota bacterium]|jgi:hypothetical protein
MKKSEITKWGRWCIAWANPGNLDSVATLLRDGQIDGVGLSPHYGYTGDPALLNDLPSFSGVVVTEAGDLDLQKIPNLDQLRFISLGGTRSRGIDLRSHGNLRDLRIVWHKGDLLPTGEGALESLYIKGYHPKTKDLTSLPEYANLETLELVQAAITSLCGVEKLRRLRELDVSYCKALVVIEALVATLVERVHFEACGRISDFPTLSRCPRLRAIRLSSCGKLQSLGFLKASKTIEEFRFVKMEVIDRDMSPLLGLKSVGFIDKPGYSHTSQQVSTIISKRIADAQQ